MSDPYRPPGYVTLQGGHCSTFKVPELDGSTLFQDWLDQHLEKSGEHPYAILVDDESQEKGEEVIITWAEVVSATYRLAAKFREQVKDEQVDGKPAVIGVYANVEPLTYATIVFGILRAGFIPFPLSVRNSLPALEHLLRKTNTRYLVADLPPTDGPAGALQTIAAELASKFPDLTILPVPRYTSLYPRLSSWPPARYDPALDSSHTPTLPPVRSLPSFSHYHPNEPLFILHSSGSTSFPKPIPIPHRIWTTWARTFWYGDTDLVGTRWASMMLPLFHISGFAFLLGFPVSAGIEVVLFRPVDPPRPPLAGRVLEAARRGGAGYMFTVPVFAVEWAAKREAVKLLAGMKAVLYGGGPLPQETGDYLVKQGVKLVIAYGSTEVGLVFKLVPERPLGGSDWNYGELTRNFITAKLVPDSNGLYRFIVLDTERHAPAVSNLPDGSFDTNDLLEPHPTKPGYWKVVGRADDQIIMGNGEKTNPGPMEDIINGNPLVRSALMFGRGRTQVGVIIEPADGIRITNDQELAEFRNKVWPDIERANAFAPQHSRIFKELILVIDPAAKPLIRTPKGTISRNAALEQYAEEIDEVYEAAERPAKAEWAAAPEKWDEEGVRLFVRRVVGGVMRSSPGAEKGMGEGQGVNPGVDLFQQGCDSLQATYIRNAITAALRDSASSDARLGEVARSVPQNLVFVHPTIDALAQEIWGKITGNANASAPQEKDDARITSMLEMVKRYTLNMPKHAPGTKTTEGEVVLITGTTGMLGSYMLERVLRDESVKRVYALNRKGSLELSARQREGFKDRGIDETLLGLAKLRLLEGDTSQADLGLDHATLAEIRASLTTIIHNAWRVDFNLSLSSFEPHVKSTRNLIDLALSTGSSHPASFIFTSSIAAITGWREDRPVPEEPIDDPHVAAGSGYGESKWVSEHILHAAAKESGLRVTIWRIGQLSGSTGNGAWNTTDWVPILIKGSTLLGGLPDFGRERVSWVPVDVAAESILEGRRRPAAGAAASGARYLHLIHPHPVAWQTLFAAVSRGLNLPLISYADWLPRLEGTAARDSAASSNPAVKLLTFFRAHAGHSNGHQEKSSAHETMGFAQLDLSHTMQVSPALRDVKSLGEEDALRWLSYWRGRGFFS